MNFDEYQKLSRDTVAYPDPGNNYIYPTLGLAGEAGEVTNKIQKVIRDKGGKIGEEERKGIEGELGDVLWYLSQLATELGLSLDDVAKNNIEQLKSRKQRGVLHGSGDNR